MLEGHTKPRPPASVSEQADYPAPMLACKKETVVMGEENGSYARWR